MQHHPSPTLFAIRICHLDPNIFPSVYLLVKILVQILLVLDCNTSFKWLIEWFINWLHWRYTTSWNFFHLRSIRFLFSNFCTQPPIFCYFVDKRNYWIPFRSIFDYQIFLPHQVLCLNTLALLSHAFFISWKFSNLYLWIWLKV